MLSVPSPQSSPEEIADHTELTALTDPDGNSSVTQVISELNITGIEQDFEEDTHVADDLEAVADATFRVLDDRRRICGTSYPFALSGGAIIREQTTTQSLYVFLLLLSNYRNNSSHRNFGAKLFEEVSALAACAYLGSDPASHSFVFGFPRRTGPTGFEGALRHLCELVLKEGLPRRDDPKLPTQKDGRLDIVAWKDFPDKRKSRLIVFGQCATGQDWEEKASSLKPIEWSKKWLREHFLPDPIACYFVPHFILEPDWRHVAIDGGILFERLRIASLAADLLSRDLQDRIGEWSAIALSRAINGEQSFE